jgi:hypothetical protein
MVDGIDHALATLYVSADALQHLRSEPFPAARVSPGEPFHPIEIDDRWLIDWYQLRSVGVPLIGPSAATLVPPISHEEWRQAIRRHLLGWSENAEGLATSAEQSYAILSMCRGLRTWRTGEQVSKREGARWASHVLPEHADLIDDALAWRLRARDHPTLDGTGSVVRTGRFIAHVKRLLD